MHCLRLACTKTTFFAFAFLSPHVFLHQRSKSSALYWHLSEHIIIIIYRVTHFTMQFPVKHRRYRVYAVCFPCSYAYARDAKFRILLKGNLIAVSRPLRLYFCGLVHRRTHTTCVGLAFKYFSTPIQICVRILPTHPCALSAKHRF